MVDSIKITSLSGRGSITMTNGSADGYWLGPVDWGQVEGSHQMYSYFNQIGSSIVSTSVITRPLSITGWVVDKGIGTMQERCDLLNSFISPVEDYQLEYKNKKITFRPDDSIIYIAERRQNNSVVRKFMIQGTCPYPLFTDLRDTEVTFDESGKRFVFPTTWGQDTDTPIIFASTEKAFTKEINNVGSFQTGIIVSINFSGYVQNPRIKNATTNKFAGVTKDFYSGERLEISTVPGDKHIYMYSINGEKSNIIKFRDYQMSWIQLMPGENVISIECSNADQRSNMDATIYFTPLYLEVQ